jgi:hypothetical protein
MLPPIESDKILMLFKTYGPLEWPGILYGHTLLIIEVLNNPTSPARGAGFQGVHSRRGP